MEKIRSNKKLITICVISAILFARCDLGIVYNKAVMLINVLVDFIAFCYCAFLACEPQDKPTKLKGVAVNLKEALLNIAVIWLVVVSLMVFIYGHFLIGTPSDFYSRQYALLTVVPALLIFYLLTQNDFSDTTDILAISGSVVIVAGFITGIIYDDCYTEWFEGTFARVGKTPAGTIVDAGNLFIILLVPVLYKLLVCKQYKKYILPTIVGVVGILLTGCKAAMIPLVLIFAIMMLGSAKDKKTLYRSILILAILFVVVVVLCFTVPILYDIVADRFIELFTGVGDKEFDLHTSTGQRMAVIAAFKAHFWEAPVFGHGFYAFKAMPYSQLEEYKENGVVMYRNIQIHMNFLEVLFSYGIVGFIIYYSLPVKLVIDAFRNHIKESKLIAFSLLVSMFFIDLGLDMYYKYLIPYFTYLVVYWYEKQKVK